MHKRVKQVLDDSAVSYKVYSHQEFDVPIHSPQDFAQALGYEVSRITKTLLLQATDAEKFCLVVTASDNRVNLKKVAEILQCKRVQMASRDTLAQISDYPPTGVSPLGVKGVSILIDEQLLKFSTILVGSGEIGVEIEISPQDLQRLTNAHALKLGM